MGLVRPRFDPFEIRFDPKNNSFGSNQIYRKFSVQRGLQHTGFSVTSKMIERVLGTRWEIDRERVSSSQKSESKYDHASIKVWAIGPDDLRHSDSTAL